MSEHTGSIVVGVDGSSGAIDSARWAAAVAARYETSLHIVHASPSLGHNLTDTVAALRAAVMSYQRDYAEIVLRSAADAVREQQPGLVVTTQSTNKPADAALIELSKSARMIVVGNPEVTAAGALFLGSTTLAVATHAACPVVAWRGSHTTPTNHPIVVGTDGTQSSAAALDAAFEFADRFGLKLAAVRSWSIPGPLAAISNPLLIDWDAVEAIEWTQLTETVDEYHKRYQGVSATCFLEPAKPPVALLNQAKADGAQLVVVGTRGRNALTSTVLGSTALNLLQHSPVPVMVCRSTR